MNSLDHKRLAIFGGKSTSRKIILRPTPFGKEETRAIKQVIKSGIFSRAGTGTFVRKFESEFADYVGATYALSTSSGTTALQTAFLSLGIGLGDEVILPSLTFVASAAAISHSGAKPVFVDVKKDTACLDPLKIEGAITTKTKAILVVHLYGYPVDMDEIVKIAKRHSLFVVEDCAQAHGAFLKGKHVGTFGDIGCFSFYQSKNMSCGEGGMLITNNKHYFNNAESITGHGLKPNEPLIYNYSRIGFNFHMSEIHAAIGSAQLKKLNKMTEDRRKNAASYLDSLKDILEFPESVWHESHVFHHLTFYLDKQFAQHREFFLKAIKAERVLVNCVYPIPLHRVDAYRDSEASCPVADDVCSRIVNLYVNPGVSRKDIRLTVSAIRKIIGYMKNKYGV